jgi:hypothetical protein
MLYQIKFEKSDGSWTYSHSHEIEADQIQRYLDSLVDGKTYSASLNKPKITDKIHGKISSHKEALSVAALSIPFYTIVYAALHYIGTL